MRAETDGRGAGGRDRGGSSADRGIADRVLDALRRHPIAEEAVAIAFATRQSERRRHAAEIERLTAEEAAQIEAALENIAAAESEVAVARSVFQAAERRLVNARLAKSAASLSGPAARGRQRHLAELVALAEPAIDGFVAEMRAFAEADRPKAYETTHRTSPTGWPDRPEYVSTGNVDSIRARGGAIDTAIARATAFKTLVDQSGVPAELARLRATIPEIRDETVRFRGPELPVPVRKRGSDEGTTIISVGGF